MDESCWAWRDEIADYAIGRLENAQRAAFEAHRSTCGRCGAEAAALGETAMQLRLVDRSVAVAHERDGDRG
jgi:anti-sigma factor RsiW